jgi:hypothetical protein
VFLHVSYEKWFMKRPKPVPIARITGMAKEQLVTLNPVAVISVRAMEDRLPAQIAPMLFSIVHAIFLLGRDRFRHALGDELPAVHPP